MDPNRTPETPAPSDLPDDVEARVEVEEDTQKKLRELMGKIETKNA